MWLGTAWFVIILVLLSIRVVQGFRLSSRLISRATVRRGSFRPLADGSDFDFESDDVFAVTDPMERLKVRHTSFENSSIDKGLAAIQEASDKRDKSQMVVAAAFAAWVLVAPKVFEVLLASIPHTTQ